MQRLWLPLAWLVCGLSISALLGYKARQQQLGSQPPQAVEPAALLPAQRLEQIGLIRISSPSFKTELRKHPQHGWVVSEKFDLPANSLVIGDLLELLAHARVLDKFECPEQYWPRLGLQAGSWEEWKKFNRLAARPQPEPLQLEFFDANKQCLQQLVIGNAPAAASDLEQSSNNRFLRVATSKQVVLLDAALQALDAHPAAWLSGRLPALSAPLRVELQQRQSSPQPHWQSLWSVERKFDSESFKAVKGLGEAQKLLALESAFGMVRFADVESKPADWQAERRVQIITCEAQQYLIELRPLNQQWWQLHFVLQQIPPAKFSTLANFSWNEPAMSEARKRQLQRLQQQTLIFKDKLFTIEDKYLRAFLD